MPPEIRQRIHRAGLAARPCSLLHTLLPAAAASVLCTAASLPLLSLHLQTYLHRRHPTSPAGSAIAAGEGSRPVPAGGEGATLRGARGRQRCDSSARPNSMLQCSGRGSGELARASSSGSWWSLHELIGMGEEMDNKQINGGDILYSATRLVKT
ncbi:unnamed protein product [Urochloa humidicola]